jgi:tripartite-type tricarboxylate transporter receptor subunit TctC
MGKPLLGNRFRLSLLAALMLSAATIPLRAVAQGYPAKPIRLVTAEAGGGNDFTARAIVRGIGDSMGQQLIVDNRGGAGGRIAAEMVATAARDGYTASPMCRTPARRNR